MHPCLPVSLHNLLTHLRGHLLARVHRRLADLALPLLAALLVGIGSHLPAQAQGADPAADWRSAETPHFRVHYRGEQRPQAERVALAAERAFVRIQRALDWTPGGRIELAVYSEFDGANGWSTPLPYNLVGAFLAPPEGELLDNSPWLDLLLTHELVHSLHLDKVAGAPGFLRGVLGRTLWSFPNLFQPSWALEGLAVYHEGGQDGGVDAAAALGRGRLYGPDFEAWLRAEQARGFIRLSELNADGRALPLSKAYLYGGYFFDFLARRYGREAVGRFVSNYSDNLLPRFHSNPRAATGKAMDVLWEEFLRDLNRQVDERNRTRRSQAEVTGQPLGAPAVLALPSVVGLGNGHTLAVVNDGVQRSRLVEFDTRGREKTLGPLLPSARLDSAANGELLITQADLCRRHYLAFDLYRWDHQAGEARRLTECAHLLRAVWSGRRVLALQLDAGRTRLVSLNLSPPGGLPQLLYAPPEGVDLVDLVALPGGLRVAFVQRQGGDWRLQELALDAAGAQPVTRLRVDAPLHSLRLGRDEPGSGTPSLEFIAARDGGSEVWRLSGERLQRLTHSHTGTVTHSGSQSAAGLATVQIAPGGHRLSRLTDPTALETLPLGPDRRWQVSGRGWATPPSASSASSPSSVSTSSSRSTPPPAPTLAPEATSLLGADRPYSALASLRPRSWWPLLSADRGLNGYGASIYGSDALRWHQYALALQWAPSQQELFGTAEVLWLDQHAIALNRQLRTLAWSASRSGDIPLLYERHTQLQWLSMLPLQKRLQQRVWLGGGLALDHVDLQETEDYSATPARRTLRNDRLAALLLDVDRRSSNWWSEGPNEGWRGTLLYETYRPFLSEADRSAGTGWNGELLRADLRGYLPLPAVLGRGVLAARFTEVRSSQRTRPYQLGGASDPQLQFGTVLNSRDIALRGYQGNEAALQGRSARVASLEWRQPLADLDRHAMVPPLGINRLSAALFIDAGRAWTPGAAPLADAPAYHRGVGLELLAELKLAYSIGLQARLGWARALDEPRGSIGYLQVGRPF